MRKVSVYRLWPDGKWDQVEIDVPSEPWLDTIVEVKAVEKAWLDLIGMDKKPIQIGMMMHSFYN